MNAADIKAAQRWANLHRATHSQAVAVVWVDSLIALAEDQAATLARVRALADQWEVEVKPNPWHYPDPADQLRAALDGQEDTPPPDGEWGKGYDRGCHDGTAVQVRGRADHHHPRPPRTETSMTLTEQLRELLSRLDGIEPQAVRINADGPTIILATCHDYRHLCETYKAKPDGARLSANSPHRTYDVLTKDGTVLRHLCWPHLACWVDATGKPTLFEGGEAS